MCKWVNFPLVLQAYLQEEYGALMIAAEDGYDVTIQVDVSALTAAPEEIIMKVRLLICTHDTHTMHTTLYCGQPTCPNSFRPRHVGVL